MAGKKKSGLLIVLEGPDGCGKSTQAGLLVEWMKSRMHLPVEHVREPGSTRVAENIRKVVQLDPLNAMSAKTEAYLYCAARSDLYEKIIVPRLMAVTNVVSERDYSSTLAYQAGVEGGFGLDELHAMCRASIGMVVPDLTIFYRPEDPARALARGTKGRKADRMEAKGAKFHKNVYEMYFKILPEFLEEREGRKIVIINSTPEPTPKAGIERAHQETKRVVEEMLRRNGRMKALDGTG